MAGTSGLLVTVTTEKPKFCLIDGSLAGKLLYGTSALALVLFILLIVRECTHRRKSSSKSKNEPDYLSPEAYSNIESQALGQQDHIKSVISDDVHSLSTDPTDRDEPLNHDSGDQSTETCLSPMNFQHSSSSNMEATNKKSSTLPEKFLGAWKHPEIPKVAALKPTVAKKNKQKETKRIEDDDSEPYVVADRFRIPSVFEERGSSGGQFYVNAQPSGACRNGRNGGLTVTESDDDEAMYANVYTVNNRAW